MKLLIGTPAYGGNVKTGYASSLFELSRALAAKAIEAEYVTLEGADVVRARNIFGSMVFERPDITHLLFVDADMKFLPDSVMRLIAMETAIVGHVYPLKRLVLERLIANARAYADPRVAIARSFDYAVPPETVGATLKIERGCMEVKGVGMGVCLIERSVFTRLAEAGLAERRTQREAESLRAFIKGDFYGFFDNVRIEDGTLLSEDYSLCHRWRESGGKVYGMVTDYLEHIGDHAFGAPYLFALDK